MGYKAGANNRKKINYVTIGVYASLNYKVNIVRSVDLDEHIRYNIKNRPGRALFVNGSCAHRGYLSEENELIMSEKFSSMEFDISEPTLPYK